MFEVMGRVCPRRVRTGVTVRLGVGATGQVEDRRSAGRIVSVKSAPGFGVHVRGRLGGRGRGGKDRAVGGDLEWGCLLGLVSGMVSGMMRWVA